MSYEGAPKAGAPRLDTSAPKNRMGLTERQQQALWKAVFGNGEAGLDEKSRNSERELANIKSELGLVKTNVQTVSSQISMLNEELRDAAAKRKGQRELAAWLKWSVGFVALVVTVLGAMNAMQVNETTREVLNTLRNIPGLPE